MRIMLKNHEINRDLINAIYLHLLLLMLLWNIRENVIL
jgi:hypothetical protein